MTLIRCCLLAIGMAVAHAGVVDVAGWPASSVSAADEGDTDKDPPSTALGVTLAIIAGTLYAGGALTSSIRKWGERTRGWEGRTAKGVSFLAFLIMCTGGVFVTFSIGTGVSTPVLNSITYATNLTLNMLFQISFGFSTYNKEMRCGTIVFALTALLLSSLAPLPKTVKLEQLWEGNSLIYWAGFISLWVTSLLSIRKVGDLPPTSSIKIMSWAIFVAGLGSFTDSWARLQGAAFSGWVQIVSFALYFAVGAALQGLTVTAFSQTQESLYVPTQLCTQLIFNVITGLMLWDELDVIPQPLPYFVAYTIVILGVYIMTPEADIISGISMSREIRAKGLSAGKARTDFGEALVKLLASWNDSKADKEVRRQAGEELLLVGLRDKILEPAHVATLTSDIYANVNPEFTPTPAMIDWLQTIPWLRDYLVSDPDLAVQLRHWQPDQGTALQEVEKIASMDVEK